MAQAHISPQPRATCRVCFRPWVTCYCRHITAIETRTRVVFLQHPRERNVAIGTARMASLCLPNSELHVGVHWEKCAAVALALSNPSREAALLYPGEGAIDVLREPPRRPLTLLVVDGTWRQAKKIIAANPSLAALPRYAFTPPSPSEYRIRREPSEECVSTIEALAHVLGAIEEDRERFLAMLNPFRAMIDTQIEFEARCQGARARHARKPKAVRPPAPPPVPSVLRDRPNDVVCVAGEANAWPYGSRERAAGCRDELVHWVARRMKSGDTFEAVVAPSHPLCPATSAHVELSTEALIAGRTMAELRERFGRFVRHTDVICSWGPYVPSLYEAAGGCLPPARLDLRSAARLFAAGKAGTPADFAVRIGAPTLPSAGPGRAMRRLDELHAIVRHLRELT